MASTQALRRAVVTEPSSVEIAACRMTGSTRLVSILDLGILPLTGIFPADATVDVPSSPLDLVLCLDGGLVQLRHSYNASEMYGQGYGYRSGLNASMVNHLRDLTSELEQRRPTRAGDVVLDIGSNDGTLLSTYADHGQTFIGMDPTAVKFARFYPSHVRWTPEFFSEAAYRRLARGRQARLVTSIAMLYDLEQPLTFMRDVSRILAFDGLWQTEQSYLPAMLDHCAYDTICQEHLEYYGLTQLQWMADRSGLRLIDAHQTPTNGGSLVVTFARRDSAYRPNLAAINALLLQEASRQLTTPEAFADFRAAVARHRRELPALIRRLKADGKTVLGYGASTKGNVLLHACGLTVEDLPCIADVNPDKHGCVTPGTKIPIVSEAEAKTLRPDYFLVLPWHFREHLVQRETEFLAGGGGLIFPLPTISVVRA